jgi:hypothetical protein
MVCIANFNRFDFFVHRYENEEFKDALAIVQKAHIPGSHLHINYLVVPLYKYYTFIHPGRNRWADLYGADETTWRTNYDSLARTFTNDAIIYEAYAPDPMSVEMAANHAHCTSVSEVLFPGGRVIMAKK